MESGYKIRFERDKKCECPFGMLSQEDIQPEIFKLPKGAAKGKVIIIASKECLHCRHWRFISWDENAIECAHPKATKDVTTIKFCKK